MVTNYFCIIEVRDKQKKVRPFFFLKGEKEGKDRAGLIYFQHGKMSRISHVNEKVSSPTVCMEVMLPMKCWYAK